MLASELEDEIIKLESATEPSTEDKARLVTLKKELESIMKKKEEYVAEHPEQRRLVYRGRKNESQGEKAGEPSKPKANRNVFDKNGLPRHPERSVYYDPVLNPYGVPPPGMPYLERSKCVHCRHI
jgi:hypothetical protein